MAVPIHEFFYLYRYFISYLYIIILTFIFKKYDRVEKGKLSEIARATLQVKLKKCFWDLFPDVCSQFISATASL